MIFVLFIRLPHLFFYDEFLSVMLPIFGMPLLLASSWADILFFDYGFEVFRGGELSLQVTVRTTYLNEVVSFEELLLLLFY